MSTFSGFSEEELKRIKSDEDTDSAFNRKVREIFLDAGEAYHRFAEISSQLLDTSGDSQPGGKWTDYEMEMLLSCVHRFSVELTNLKLKRKEKPT